jgi:hypothetical protein
MNDAEQIKSAGRYPGEAASGGEIILRGPRQPAVFLTPLAAPFVISVRAADIAAVTAPVSSLRHAAGAGKTLF